MNIVDRNNLLRGVGRIVQEDQDTEDVQWDDIGNLRRQLQTLYVRFFCHTSCYISKGWFIDKVIILVPATQRSLFKLSD